MLPIKNIMLKLFFFSPQSPDGKYLASGAIDGIINIFDIATGKLLHTLEGGFKYEYSSLELEVIAIIIYKGKRVRSCLCCFQNI